MDSIKPVSDGRCFLTTFVCSDYGPHSVCSNAVFLPLHDDGHKTRDTEDHSRYGPFPLWASRYGPHGGRYGPPR